MTNIVGYIVIAKDGDTLRPSVQRIWTNEEDAIKEKEHKTKTNVWGRRVQYHVCTINE